MSFKILDKLFVGRKPPDEINVKAKFKESNVLMDRIFKIRKIKKVIPEYIKKILSVCFKTSELLNEIKLVNVFLKLSS